MRASLVAATCLILAFSGCVGSSKPGDEEGSGAPASEFETDGPVNEYGPRRSDPAIDESFELRTAADPTGGFTVYPVKVPADFNGQVELSPRDLGGLEGWAVLAVLADSETFQIVGSVVDVPVYLGLSGPGSETLISMVGDPQFLQVDGVDENATLHLLVAGFGGAGKSLAVTARFHSDESQPDSPRDLNERGANATKPLYPAARAQGTGFHFGLYLDLVFFFDIIGYTPNYETTRTPDLDVPVVEGLAYEFTLATEETSDEGWIQALGYADGNYGEWSFDVTAEGEPLQGASEYLYAPGAGYVQGKPMGFLVEHTGTGGLQVDFRLHDTEYYRSPTILFVHQGFGADPMDLFGAAGPETLDLEASSPIVPNVAALSTLLP